MPASHIKPCAMARADDLIAIQVAIPQGTVVVGANIADREEFSANIEQHNWRFIHLKDNPFAWKKVFCG